MATLAIAPETLRVGHMYSRKELAGISEGEKLPRNWLSGVLEFDNAGVIFLFATLEKEGEYTYEDFFDGPSFWWQSQTQQTQLSPVIQSMRMASKPVHLFARIRAKDDRQNTLQFVYCGQLLALDMQGANPVTVQFQALDFVPQSPPLALKQVYSWRSSKLINQVELDRRDVMQTRQALGQGNITDAALRKKIELHGMSIAKAHYSSLSFVVEDTSQNRPYDLLCRKGDDVRRVEVKATQGLGQEVVVTVGEVRSANELNVTTDLFVVHSVVVRKLGDAYDVTGGEVRVVSNWRPAPIDLSPTTFRCRVHLGDSTQPG